MYVTYKCDSQRRQCAAENIYLGILKMSDVKVLAVLSIATLALSGQANAADRATGTFIGAGAGANITQGAELNGNGASN